MSYKLRAKPFATPCHDLLFALAQMDLSQAESGLMLSAIAYMYGTPQQWQKSALINVATGPWLNSQRSARGDCYRALKRLVWRGILIETTKARYILNTDYGAWKDRTGATVFQDGAQAVSNLKALCDARPYWRDTNTGNAPVKSVDNPEAEADQGDETEPETAAEGGGIHHQPRWSTPPEKVVHTTTPPAHIPPKQVVYTTDQPPETAPPSARGPDAKADMQKQDKAAAEGSPDALAAFARVVCLLTPADMRDFAQIGASATPAALTMALEKLANRNSRPTNVGGFLRDMVRRFQRGERLTLPEGAITVDRWHQDQQRRAALRQAMQLPANCNDQQPQDRALDESTLANPGSCIRRRIPRETRPAQTVKR